MQGQFEHVVTLDCPLNSIIASSTLTSLCGVLKELGETVNEGLYVPIFFYTQEFLEGCAIVSKGLYRQYNLIPVSRSQRGPSYGPPPSWLSMSLPPAVFLCCVCTQTKWHLRQHLAAASSEKWAREQPCKNVKFVWVQCRKKKWGLLVHVVVITWHAPLELPTSLNGVGNL